MFEFANIYALMYDNTKIKNIMVPSGLMEIKNQISQKYDDITPFDATGTCTCQKKTGFSGFESRSAFKWKIKSGIAPTLPDL